MLSLRTPSEFRKGYRQGKRFAGKTLILFVSSNDLKENRLGITVSKKNGNSVARHRFSRLVKEVFRLEKERLGTGHDFMVVMKKEVRIGPTAALTFSGVQQELLQLLGRAKVFN
ncbi:MAG: ribonuclease P protein component [Lachnospiraceae bacterium]|nr:ribonuclease P protein component [Lachnospiraceae bacterium]